MDRVLVEVKPPVPKSVGGFLPNEDDLRKVWEDTLDAVLPQMNDNAASVIDLLSAYSKGVVAEWYIGQAPPGVNMGNNVCCHGAGVQVTTYCVYFMEKRPAYSPENFYQRYGHYPRIFRRQYGQTYQVSVMRGPYEQGLGRAGGFTGWDKLRDLFAYALASFKHNFEALLGAFASRPKLPCYEAWHLPNLVYAPEVTNIERRYHAHIVAPPVAVPPASYKFNFAAPAPAMVLAVGTKCPQDTHTYIEFWDSQKRDMVQPFKVTFPSGENETIISLRAIPPFMLQSGYFNINPVNSPMTVSYVKVLFPPL